MIGFWLRIVFLVALLGWQGTVSARGQLSCEVVLLINQNDPVSVWIGHVYAAGRGVPPERVIKLNLPAAFQRADSTITPEEFTSYIWNPVLQRLVERGLSSTTLAWVYSTGFPTRIAMTPPLSLTGMTFVRNQPPEPDLVQSGRFFSPYFAGPMEKNGPKVESVSLFWKMLDPETVRKGLPNMMLGVTGPRGNIPAEILEMLGKSMNATVPKKPVVYYIVNENKRSLIRQWQFAGAAKELRQLGITVSTPKYPPRKAHSVLGVMDGRISPNPSFPWTFVPGAVADHLTSFGAVFDKARHGKLTYWIAKGATSSSGTVTEPLAIWTKFPHARFYAHYARGCTVLESYMQSIACPLQVLLVGDPLVAPFAEPLSVTWRDETTTEGVAVHTVHCKDSEVRVVFYLDGRILPTDMMRRTVRVSAPGVHRLTAMAFTTNRVRRTAVLEREFFVAGAQELRVKRQGTGPIWEGEPLDLSVSVDTPATSILLESWDQLVGSLPSGTGGTIQVNSALLGRGPIWVRATAELEGGRKVKSRTLHLEVAVPPEPIIIGTPIPHRLDEGTDVWRGLVAGLLADSPPKASLFQRVELPSELQTMKLATINREGREFHWKVGEGWDVWQIASTPDVGVTVGFSVTPGPRFTGNESVGVAFNIKSKRRFDFFGLYHGWGWVFATVRAGEWSVVSSLPQAVAQNRGYTLTVSRLPGGGLRGWIEGVCSLDWPNESLEEEPFGVAARQVPGTLLLSDPASRIAGLSFEDDEWYLPRQEIPSVPMLIRVRQGSRWAQREWNVP